MGTVVTLPLASVLGGLLKVDEGVRQDEMFRILFFAVPNVMYPDLSMTSLFTAMDSILPIRGPPCRYPNVYAALPWADLTSYDGRHQSEDQPWRQITLICCKLRSASSTLHESDSRPG